VFSFLENNFAFFAARIEDEEGRKSKGTPTESGGGFSEKWTRMVYKLRVPIVKALQAMTSVAANNPKRTITGIIVFSIGIFVLGLVTNFTLDTSEQLWTPKNSKPVDVSTSRFVNL
jgi:hypothetical protein